MAKEQRERRRRGDGTVSVAKRDANGRPILWKASISLGVVTIDGKARRNRPTEYAATEAEAHQKLKLLQSKHLTGEDLAPDKQTLEAFLYRWLEHIKTIREPGTYEEYESKCRVHIIPAIGGIRLKALKTTHVQTMLDALVNKGLKPSTVKGVRRVVVRALNMARKWGDVKYNVAIDTETPQAPFKKPFALNDAQLDKLLDIIAGTAIEDIVLVALATGARIGEILGLLWSNIDYQANELHITGAVKRDKLDQKDGTRAYVIRRVGYTKTKDERDQHLPSATADLFRTRWKLQQGQRTAAGRAWKEQGLVFTDANGGPLNPNTVSNKFTRLAKLAGLPRALHFHSLRHSCATYLIKQGEQQRTVMEILGHRNVATAAKYGVVLPEVSRDALDKHAERLSRRTGAK
jgi:integrase